VVEHLLSLSFLALKKKKKTVYPKRINKLSKTGIKEFYFLTVLEARSLQDQGLVHSGTREKKAKDAWKEIFLA
jgi:hypothetical protein